MIGKVTRRVHFACDFGGTQGPLANTEWLLPPCIGLARRKFELTKQGSAGGKNFVLRSMKANRKAIEIISMEVALNTHES